MHDQDVGLIQKYYVSRLNDLTGKHDMCTFFVLDITHDPYARITLQFYADTCRVEFPALAVDLDQLLKREPLAR